MSILLLNKHARRNYEILDSFTGGLVLSGPEVKSLRAKQATLNGAFLTVRNSELFIKHLSISPYQPKNMPTGYDPEVIRKVLVTKRELATIEKELNNKGTTLIPLSIDMQNNRVKISFALARGKKKYDKREDLKMRAQKRDAERENKVRFK